ncbi:MAG: hypothetical protein JXL97_08500, partial [Bacteroidales bacterium]|nr:hypothetical protein [Bacteroidales bacterium]
CSLGITQSFSRFSYAFNNPLKYTDPSGEIVWVPFAISAVIGGTMNLIAHWDQVGGNGWDGVWNGVSAFAIGAAAGAIAVGTGGALAPGFIGAFAGGAIGSAYFMGIQSIGNNLYFGDDYPTATEFAVGMALGGTLAGISGGVGAVRNGRNFWTGKLKPVKPNYLPLDKRLPSFEISDEEALRNSLPQKEFADDLFNDIKYTDKVLDQATWNDFHGFPESVDAFTDDAIIYSFKSGDGIWKTAIEIPGNYKGHSGVFQYYIEADGSCNHRQFISKASDFIEILVKNIE